MHQITHNKATAFQSFLNQLKTTNITLEDLTDFQKASDNTEKIKLYLCQLNYLLNSNNLKKSIHKLYLENNKAFSVLGILCAVRDNIQINRQSFNDIVQLASYFESEDTIYEYLQRTGLETIFTNRKITNLVDYVFGIEVGLDTNARKNRGGQRMEKTVASLLCEVGINFESQVQSSLFPNFTALGVDLKRFDFVIKTKSTTYLIETNFYNGGGSKLNETARSYTELSEKIDKTDSMTFVWVTDGKGWIKAETKLEEAFRKIPHLYNLTSIKYFIEKVKSEL